MPSSPPWKGQFFWVSRSRNDGVRPGGKGKNAFSAVFIVLVILLGSFWSARAVLPPAKPPLPNFDERTNAPAALIAPATNRSAAVARVQSALPQSRIDFDGITGSPAWISAKGGFLTGSNGTGRAISAASLNDFATDDPHRIAKAFISEHRALFGHGPEALAAAKVKRDFVATNNGLHTVVWEQHVDDIPVFEGLFIANTTKNGELVNLSSHFMADPATAASTGTPNRADLQASPTITAAQALAAAAGNLGEYAPTDITLVSAPGAEDARKHQQFHASTLKGPADAQLVWLPMNGSSMRLCWEIILMSKARGEMYRVLIDAQSGRALLRHCLTAYISDATYRVYNSDSPTPFSPGSSTPQTNQPPEVPRVLIVTNAFDTNASPNGWINDGVNETAGNNVDAHTDHSGNDVPDLPRPQGSPFRVFDFPLDLTQDPLTYSSASVVQLFYLCNYYHDRLYELGFTEAAGNFQSNNFGRGGLGNDPVIADGQDGGGTDNANFSTPPDGSSGRMQMYLFTGPTPRRDGSLDAEVVFHEHTHGLSNRLIGGGNGLNQVQSGGMGEGWSDFYALCLLSQPGDDVHGNYAAGAYVSYLLGPGFTQNYYFGIRRYPYSTDMTKNPLTFKDIDPAQESAHSGIPTSPEGGGSADEVHNQGEVWCVTLWEARANMIDDNGYAGNQTMMQLVTDGMKLTPSNPDFLQARDAILQADMVDTGGAHQIELWTAFAKRGMGFSATSPGSATTSGVHEAFDMPFIPLSVSVPATATEGNGVLVGQGLVTLGFAAPTNVVVTLTSSNTAEVTVPATVTVLSGQSNATFDVTIVDDNRLDGTQVTRINASATGYAPAHADISVNDNESAVLIISAPAAVTEGSAPFIATVSMSGVAGANVNVTLSSSDTNMLVVPALATILTGQTSAVFNVTVVDDTKINGDHNATITAHVANWTDGSTNITIHDNESTNLTVLLPAVATEGDGVLTNAGSVKIAGTLTTNLTVTLFSDDTTELIVPPSVIINAGQTIATFNLTIVDDTNVDGAQIVHVIASAPSFGSGTTNMTVFDDETPPLPVNPTPPHLAMNVAANTDLAWDTKVVELIQNGGFETGDFTGWSKQNTGLGDFVINDGTVVPPGIEGAVPPYSGTYSVLAEQSGPGSHTIYQDVFIPPNSTSAVLSWVDRIRNYATSFSASQSFRAEIRSTNDVVLQTLFTNNINDPMLNNWQPRSFNVSNFVGQTVRLAFTETDSQNYLNVDLDNVSLLTVQAPAVGTTNYDVYFGTNPAPGPAQFLGTTSNAAWNLPLLTPQTTYYWQIVAHKLGTISGPVWQFTTAGADHFAWNPINTTQFVGVPIPVTLTAKDTFNSTVSNYFGPISLKGAIGAGVVEDFETGVWPHSPWVMNAPSVPGTIGTNYAHDGLYGLDGPEWTYRTDFSIGGSSTDTLSWWVRPTSTSGAGRAYLGFGASAAGCWSVVLAQNTSQFVLQRNAGFGFQTIVTQGQSWQPNKWYKIVVQFPSTISVVCNLYDSDGTTLLNTVSYNNVSGLPGGVAMRSFGGVSLDTIRGPQTIVPITPTNSGVFSNGIWTGNITVLQPATNLVLLADDGNNHTGGSVPLNVFAGLDLSVTVGAAPNPDFAGNAITYSISVSNAGPSGATGARVTNSYPGGAAFISAGASQGTQTNSGNQVVFSLGNIASGGSATMNVVVAPPSAGPATNIAVVAANEVEMNPANNSATNITTVMAKPVLLFSTSSGSLNLNWTGPYILQTATNAAGPYVDVTGAANSFSTNMTASPQRFFRLRN